MLNLTKLATISILGAWMAGACLAQSDSKPVEPVKFYRLDFVVKELDAGKVVNARTYSTSASAKDGGWACTIRTGNKVPVPTGMSADKTQYTYIDVGVNFDCKSIKEIDGQLSMVLTAEISSGLTSDRPPMIRQTKWSSDVLVPLRKPTLIYSSDDVAGKGQMQLELTATPLK
jgi:hypothetical protein